MATTTTKTDTVKLVEALEEIKMISCSRCKMTKPYLEFKSDGCQKPRGGSKYFKQCNDCRMKKRNEYRRRKAKKQIKEIVKPKENLLAIESKEVILAKKLLELNRVLADVQGLM